MVILARYVSVQQNMPQGWAAKLLENQGHPQAAWRTDLFLRGCECSFDLGTHAHPLGLFCDRLAVYLKSRGRARLCRAGPSKTMRICCSFFRWGKGKL